MTFTVEVIPPINSAITFDFATSVESTDNATAGSDFATTTRTDETIVANAPNYTFNIPITGDNTPEPDETFTVTLSNVTASITAN